MHKLSKLGLDARADVCIKILRDILDNCDPNYVKAAWNFHGKTMIEKLDWDQRYAIYKIMQRICDNSDRILHHQAMRDNVLIVNWYKWKLDNDGERYATCDDWKYYDLLSIEEQELLCNEWNVNGTKSIRLND